MNINGKAYRTIRVGSDRWSVEIIDQTLLPHELRFVTLRTLEEAARAYITGFRRHMRKEEAEILPLAAQLLDAKDWSDIGAKIRHIEDPLFGTSAEERYSALRRQIAREARA